MDWPERVANWGQEFPNYPPTIYSHGWVYGVWYCSKSWIKNRLYGQYPRKFKERALALWPDVSPERILQVCSGTVTEPGVCLDVSRQFDPTVQADAEALPFQDGVFDLILYDPPYSAEDAKEYGQVRAPRWRRVREEFLRVLSPTGHIGILHKYYPDYRRKEMKLVGLIAVITGFLSMTRVFSIFEKAGADALR